MSRQIIKFDYKSAFFLYIKMEALFNSSFSFDVGITAKYLIIKIVFILLPRADLDIKYTISRRELFSIKGISVVDLLSALVSICQI